MMTEDTLKQACLKRRYEVSECDLPLSCPMPDQRVWDAHPRVYLPIKETGWAICPYCSAEFVLKND
ncbi:MAG: zinc-finger domain-containing protein [Gammaproteobacteria bacterium]|nr:zinc-finger domain-containing protein [Gammaproteobacteria bacterium]